MADDPRRLEYVPLDDLVPDDRNPKAHDLEELRASMGRWGYTQPIEVDERTGKLVSGHGRRELLIDDKAAGRQPPDGVTVRADDGAWCVPVVRGWSSADDDEAWAYLVAANRIPERGGWNYERLVPGLQLAAEREGGLDGIGYKPPDLSDLVGLRQRERDQARPRLTDPDDVPAVPSKPVTKPGDVWLCGPHRIACGDATDKAVVGAALGGRPIDLVFSSPPYNVGVAYDAHDDAEVEWSGYRTFLAAVLEVVVPHLAEGRALCWNVGVSPKTHMPRQLMLLEELGLTFVRQLVWQKVGVAVPLWHNTRTNRVARQFTPNYQHEVVLVFGKGELQRGGPTDFDDTLEHDVFRLHQSASSRDIPTDESKGRTGNQSNLDRRSRKAHPAPFPVDLPRAFIAHLADVDAVVYDPFVGVGSTVMAAHLSGRVGVGVDLSPAYVDVALERWQRHTGEVPVLERTGKPHIFVRQ